MEAVKLCLELGADVNAANTMGLTAVMGAANRGSDEILQFLVSKGARLDVKDKEGRTPYNWAEGVFLATNAPEQKPSTMALIKRLTGERHP
jgi:ankyrin repeat protein